MQVLRLQGGPTAVQRRQCLSTCPNLDVVPLINRGRSSCDLSAGAATSIGTHRRLYPIRRRYTKDSDDAKVAVGGRNLCDLLLAYSNAEPQMGPGTFRH